MYQLTSRGMVLRARTEYHNYTVTSLRSDTTYSFTVKPYNQAGEGPGAVNEVTTTGSKLWCRSVVLPGLTAVFFLVLMSCP